MNAEGMVDLAKDYQPKGAAVVAISSNSVKTHPQDGPTEMAKDAEAFGARSSHPVNLLSLPSKCLHGLLLGPF